ncbi:hypothetical protein TH63_05255 [Rufibacter radiotolerans]|uniref:DUF4386 domain-containing protein n=1 Tax=Rufibacter radiotolerans TaxID=1379910 RepID=A0A0H4VIG1_9BACT|nr:hypothetical protein [Rufibacter radiotolerans]AKQ45173.1 hypothetical protein TH63_05255 [Rufibacter radiotolerans]
MENRIIICLGTIGLAGFVFAFGDLLIPQENVILEAASRPEEFSRLVTSPEYSIWALRGFVGVTMEMIGTIGLYLYLQNTKAERLAFYGLLLTLVHQLLGIGVFSIAYFLFPAAGELFLMGQTGVIKYVTMGGALQNFMGLSLMSTLLGLAVMALAVWKSRALPKWSGWLAFLGFAMIPLPGVALQFFTNLLWGAAYFWMAYGVYKNHTHLSDSETSVAKQLVA